MKLDAGLKLCHAPKGVDRHKLEDAAKTLAYALRARPKLNCYQRRIVVACVNGATAEEVMQLAEASYGHCVYDYVKVDMLIEIIAALAKRPNAPGELPGAKTKT